MKNYLLIGLISFSFGISANASTFDCKDLEFSKLQLSVHASNLLNAKTTRTPEGGAYKPKVLIRKGDGSFAIQSANFTKMVYEPGHPDSDANGMVTYPNIDVSSENQAVTVAAKTIELLAANKICSTTALRKSNSLLVKYQRNKFTTSDFFTFKKNGDLETWTSYPTSGAVYTVTF